MYYFSTVMALKGKDAVKINFKFFAKKLQTTISYMGKCKRG